MPVKVEYTDNDLGVIFHQEGVVTEEELYSKLLDVFADEKYPKLKYWITDRTNIEKFHLEESGLQKIAKLSNKESERNPGMLLAFVSPSDLAYGMLRRYEGAHIGQSKFTTKVFRDKISAEQWIQENISY